MKRLPLILSSLIVLVALTAYAAFPIHTNSGQSDMDAISGNWDSFRWVWMQHQTESNILTLTQGASAYQLTNATGIGFSMSYMNVTQGYVTAYSTTNITISTTTAVWSVAATSVPNPGVYRAELYAWEGATSNSIRVLGQGKIRVVEDTW